MLQPIVISKRVLETLKSLPLEERRVISGALASEFLIGENPESTLSSFHAMVYSMIRYYVRHDSERGCEHEGRVRDAAPAVAY